ncbi:MAG: hypothetical protein U0031_06305 [Thermomicrobiales bacterium]
MSQNSSPRTAHLNRRAAVASAGAAAATMAMFSIGRAAAQDGPLAGHPLTGTWLAMANPPLPQDPPFPAPSLFAADGTVLLLFPVTARGPRGAVFQTAYVGVWEADSDRRGHFTATQSLSAADGAFLGTVTVEGFPEVSADGQTFSDDGSRVMVTMRDASGAIVDQIMPTGEPDGRPVTGVRMAVGAPGFPVIASDATPAVGWAKDAINQYLS